jgi:peptidoglycan hydrolase-like protein with peptidoglycan-binding domain
MPPALPSLMINRSKLSPAPRTAGGTSAPPPPKKAATPAARAPIDGFEAGAKPKTAQHDAFALLEGSTQAQVYQAMLATHSPEARNNIVTMATTKGFAELSLRTRAQALASLMKDPGSTAYAQGLIAVVNDGGPFQTLELGAHGPAVKDLQHRLIAQGHDAGPVDGHFGQQTLVAVNAYQLENNLKQDGRASRETRTHLNRTQFSALPSSTQVHLLAVISNHHGDAGAQKTLEAVGVSRGFQYLEPEQQNKLLSLVGGTNRDLSKPARAGLERMMAATGYATLNGPDQLKALNTFLSDEAGLPPQVVSEPGAFDGRHAYLLVTGPVQIKAHPFEGGKADAFKYEVQIGDQKIPVLVAKKVQGKLKTNSLDEVVRGLVALPLSSRRLVKEVSLESAPSKDDPMWAIKYNDPNFHAYMSAGAPGVVSVYPVKVLQPQSSLSGALIHETGHILSLQKWGADADGPAWNDWRKAGLADGTSASEYAKKSPHEDFGETLQAYHEAKGTPQEAEVRALMPARFKIIDELLSGQR